MTEMEKLIDRQIADTKHVVRGGKFDRFNGKRIALPTRETKTDRSGLVILSWHKKA